MLTAISYINVLFCKSIARISYFKEKEEEKNEKKTTIKTIGFRSNYNVKLNTQEIILFLFFKKKKPRLSTQTKQTNKNVTVGKKNINDHIVIITLYLNVKSCRIKLKLNEIEGGGGRRNQFVFCVYGCMDVHIIFIYY